MAKKPLGVLILHGFTAHISCVDAIEPPVKALGLPTRMPILRGHGGASAEALRGVTWQDWLADGTRALEDLLGEVKRVAVFGHSMGGLVALNLGAEHPDTVESLVLAAPAVQMVNPIAPYGPLHFLAPLVERLFATWKVLPVYADPERAQFDRNYRRLPMPAIRQFLDFIEATRPRLPEVRQPLVILQSRNDRTVDPKSAEIVCRGVSTPEAQKRVVWFERTGHEMFLDCERDAAVRTVVECMRERMTPGK